MKNKILLLTFAFAILSNLVAFAQNNISGTVVDKNKEPITGVNIIKKNQPGFGVITDIDGKFTINVSRNDILVFSYIGYDDQEVVVNNRTSITVTMTEAAEQIEELVVVGAGVQRKASIVGSITTVEVADLTVPSANISNSLAGNVAGIIARQTSGEPGSNNSEFWIRGISTFGANSSALVLIDGVERDMDEVNAEDIESFSILKDASATAIYGQRGANGVVIITTKKGHSGKTNISAKLEYGVVTPSRMPEYVDATTYAELANEARLSRYQEALYDEAEMAIIKYGLDPDLYPDVNWYDEVLNDVTTNMRASVNFSGGGETARYYVSGSYYNEDGLYKINSLNDYNTNAKYNRYNFRANVDMNLTSTTILEVGVGGWVTNQNNPGSSSSYIWSSLSNLTAITVPVLYSNGYFPTYGSGSQTNPSVLLTETGYITKWESKMETNARLSQKLDFITEGLKFSASFSFDTYSTSSISRLKNPDLYKAESQRDNSGELIFNRIVEASALTQSSSSSGDRRYTMEAYLDYSRVFDDKHRVSALARVSAEEYSDDDAGSSVLDGVPERYQSLAGRATYSYDDRYLFEVNVGYTGSENFEAGNQFGLFPAVALGWMATNEEFLKDSKWLTLFKVRASLGVVGNSELDDRFPYITQLNTSTSGYTFGAAGTTSTSGVAISTLGAPNLTWETSTKYNLGFDVGLFDKVNLVVDVYKDIRDNIFMQRSNIPDIAGLGSLEPWANVGKMESQGIDGTVSYLQKIGNVDVTFRGNFTYSYSNVIEYDEADNALSYQMTEGYRWGQTRGYVALGLFEDQADIDNSPTQTFSSSVLPGDIKYKDVNGDGIINTDDKVPIGYSTIPGFTYGFGASAVWKAFDFNILFQGSGNCDFFISGESVYPFSGGEIGNILTAVADPSDRWISSEISGDPSTENPNATFPRLTYGDNTNNNINSTFWLRNGRYLRLKNLEVGYTLPREVARKWMLSNVRFYAIGTNLLVFSPFDWWDPEIGSSDGATYPISKTVTVGVNFSF